jgi:hypothetical protein
MEWRGVRGPKSASVDGRHELFGFLTTEANAIVAPIHPKAMPVILTNPEEVDQWLEADIMDALALQRPLPDDALRIGASGEKKDGVPPRNPFEVEWDHQVERIQAVRSAGPPGFDHCRSADRPDR